MKISLSQFKRFEKQIILKKIGLAGQKRIFSANVLIVGLGGLGCPLLTYLTSSGVGRIGIIDYDKVEISNLNRQTIFSPADIGKFKVSVAKKMIRKHFSKLIEMATKEDKPFEKNLHEIYKKEKCFSPIPSLSIHCANINSVFGVSPNVDIKRVWDESK